MSISKSGIIGGDWDRLKDLFDYENEKKKKTIILKRKKGGGEYRDYTDGSGWIPIPEDEEVTIPAYHKIATSTLSQKF